MNEPIISPWIFYWISLADNFLKISSIGTTLPVLFFILVASLWLFGAIDDMGDRDRERFMKALKVAICCFSISFPLSVLIPGQQTMYKMLITSQITPNNIEYLKNEVKATCQGLVDSITDASIKIIKAKESK